MIEVKEMARDPICGMMVDENQTKLKTVHKGETYYFCMMSCKKAFDSDPDRFAIESGNK